MNARATKAELLAKIDELTNMVIETSACNDAKANTIRELKQDIEKIKQDCRLLAPPMDPQANSDLFWLGALAGVVVTALSALIAFGICI